MVSFTITGSDSGTQALISIDGEIHAIDDSHANFPAIYDKLISGDYAGLSELVSPTKEILASYGGAVTIEGSTLYYNGEPLYTNLAKTVLDFYRKGLPVGKLINFMEKLMQNPSRNSREQFYEFLNRHNFSITENGDFLAFKGISNDLTSVHAGPGVVNGVKENGNLDNTPGNILEMDRFEVVDNPGIDCAVGLHVGSYNYASSFAPVVVEVVVNPRDIVSVPNDSNHQKVRVCRYTVLRVVNEEVASADRYDTVDNFISWLSQLAPQYSRKGKVSASFRALADRFVEDTVEVDTNALDSFVAEIEGRKLTSQNVYRYHIDSLVEDYYNTKEEEEEDTDYDDDYYDEDYGY